jgi:hypothetical protein
MPGHAKTEKAVCHLGADVEIALALPEESKNRMPRSQPG